MPRTSIDTSDMTRQPSPQKRIINPGKRGAREIRAYCRAKWGADWWQTPEKGMRKREATSCVSDDIFETILQTGTISPSPPLPPLPPPPPPPCTNQGVEATTTTSAYTDTVICDTSDASDSCGSHKYSVITGSAEDPEHLCDAGNQYEFGTIQCVINLLLNATHMPGEVLRGSGWESSRLIWTVSSRVFIMTSTWQACTPAQRQWFLNTYKEVVIQKH